jgi:polysaccharide biosynthesis transport protein
MIRPLLDPFLPGRDEVAEELQGHYWALLDRLDLMKDNGGERSKVIGVTSCTSGEGVSTIASSLAMTAASSAQGTVLLIDANSDRPAVHRLLGVKPAPGLAEALANPSPSPAYQPSTIPSLTVLTAGAVEKCPTRNVAVSSFAALLPSLQKRFVLVVVDLPPAEPGGLALQLAGRLDGVLLVVEAERIRGEEVRQRKDLLARANARLLGVVFNKQRHYVPASLDRWI